MLTFSNITYGQNHWLKCAVPQIFSVFKTICYFLKVGFIKYIFNAVIKTTYLLIIGFYKNPHRLSTVLIH